MANSDNPKKGALFEEAVGRFLASQGVRVQRNFPVPIGVGATKRPRKFDLGSDTPKVVIECKSHSWTESGNAPSAKMATWNEAMYYFSLVPDDYRKMMFVLLNRVAPERDTAHLLHQTLRPPYSAWRRDVEIRCRFRRGRINSCRKTKMNKRVNLPIERTVIGKGVCR